MNIFYVDKDPSVAARALVDKHVVKMILESCQLLSTAHRVLDGVEYIGQSKSGRKAKRYRLDGELDQVLYSATHINHPSAVWCRATSQNYIWLHVHLTTLLAEYYFRYGKNHACVPVSNALAQLPKNIKRSELTEIVPAMPDKYIVPGDPVASYRAYYNGEKRDLFKWTRRPKPDWVL